ncbi:hypothetical protein QUF70_06200 [Desulfobacterales bacterium HSG17]|nr:hypothetical protein [Desulfobacterales bacterium HSG17]
MISHTMHTIIGKSGYLEIKNLPFEEGTRIKVTISNKEKQKNLDKLINNTHVWTEEDIKAVEKGREIINQWKIF